MPGPKQAEHPAWGQEVTVKMQGVLEDRTVVEKDPKLVFVIGEGDVNQVGPKDILIGTCPVVNTPVLHPVTHNCINITQGWTYPSENVHVIAIGLSVAITQQNWKLSIGILYFYSVSMIAR